MKRCLIAILLVVPWVALAVTPAFSQALEVVYTFTGAMHNSDLDFTSCVTCTYTGQKTTNVTVQFFDKDGSFSDAGIPDNTPVEAVDSFTANTGNTTETFCVEQTLYYDSEELPPITPADYIDQGFIRVLVTDKQAKFIICDAVVVDSANTPPTFIYPLNGERNKSKKYYTSKDSDF